MNVLCLILFIGVAASAHGQTLVEEVKGDFFKDIKLVFSVTILRFRGDNISITL